MVEEQIFQSGDKISHKEWYISGQIKSEEICVDGERTSIRSWFSNGQIEEELLYSAGECICEKEWTIQGKLISFLIHVNDYNGTIINVLEKIENQTKPIVVKD